MINSCVSGLQSSTSSVNFLSDTGCSPVSVLAQEGQRGLLVCTPWHNPTNSSKTKKMWKFNDGISEVYNSIVFHNMRRTVAWELLGELQLLSHLVDAL
jgi:hypothetical protein